MKGDEWALLGGLSARVWACTGRQRGAREAPLPQQRPPRLGALCAGHRSRLQLPYWQRNSAGPEQTSAGWRMSGRSACGWHCFSGLPPPSVLGQFWPGFPRTRPQRGTCGPGDVQPVRSAGGRGVASHLQVAQGGRGEGGLGTRCGHTSSSAPCLRGATEVWQAGLSPGVSSAVCWMGRRGADGRPRPWGLL